MMRLGTFVDTGKSPVDEVMAVYMPKGKSYTGLDQIEIFCHGGRLVVRRILDILLAAGARTAEPGEFTKLAFLAGRIDLARAEAVAEIISANTENSLQAAREHLLGPYTAHIDLLRDGIIEILAEVEASVDFPEDEIDPATTEAHLTLADTTIDRISTLAATYKGGRLIREGYTVAIGGRPNAGKSSLFNLLLRQERALVTPTAGTTRDYLSEWIDLDGFAVNLIDTAGLRGGGNKIELAGQKSAKKVMSLANSVLWIVDVSHRSWKKRLQDDLENLKGMNILLLANKIDLLKSLPIWPDQFDHLTPVFLSCQDGRGLTEISQALVERINSDMPDLTSGLVVTSARHRQKLNVAAKNLRAARKKITAGQSPEIIAFDLRQATAALEEITGRVYNEDILGRIFSKFCIGK